MLNLHAFAPLVFEFHTSFIVICTFAFRYNDYDRRDYPSHDPSRPTTYYMWIHVCISIFVGLLCLKTSFCASLFHLYRIIRVQLSYTSRITNFAPSFWSPFHFRTRHLRSTRLARAGPRAVRVHLLYANCTRTAKRGSRAVVVRN